MYIKRTANLKRSKDLVKEQPDKLDVLIVGGGESPEQEVVDPKQRYQHQCWLAQLPAMVKYLHFMLWFKLPEMDMHLYHLFDLIQDYGSLPSLSSIFFVFQSISSLDTWMTEQVFLCSQDYYKYTI